MCDHGHKSPANQKEEKKNCSCPRHAPRLEGFLIPCLLLLLKKNPAHGYELMEKLSKLPCLDSVPDPGAVYRHLRRLEQEGMVESRLEPGSGGPARKIYLLTLEGEEYLDSWAVNIRRRQELLARFLEEYSRGAAAGRKEGEEDAGT